MIIVLNYSCLYAIWPQVSCFKFTIYFVSIQFSLNFFFQFFFLIGVYIRFCCGLTGKPGVKALIGDFAILMKEQQHNIPLFRRLDGVSLAHKICALFFPCSSTIKHLDLADQQIVLDKILEICSNSQRARMLLFELTVVEILKKNRKKSNFDSPKPLNSPLSKQLPNLSWPNSLLSTPTRAERRILDTQTRAESKSSSLPEVEDSTTHFRRSGRRRKQKRI